MLACVERSREGARKVRDVISAGHSRRYADVPPVKGISRGSSTSTLEAAGHDVATRPRGGAAQTGSVAVVANSTQSGSWSEMRSLTSSSEKPLRISPFHSTRPPRSVYRSPMPLGNQAIWS